MEFYPTVVLPVDTANCWQTDAFLMEIYARICESLLFLQAKGSTDYSSSVFPAVGGMRPLPSDYEYITDEPC